MPSHVWSGAPLPCGVVYDQMQTCYRHPDQPAGVICQRCDRPICPRCMNQASVGFHCPECAKVGAQKVYRGTAALQTRPLLTQVLIAANVAVFVLAAVIDGGGALQGSIGSVHIDFGLIARAFYRGELIGVAEGEWYRMVTSGFLHFGVIHLLFNMYALWILGGAVEHLAGRARLAAGYGVSVLAGSLGALILSPDSLTAGASGGVFGLMGFILVAQRLQGLPFPGLSADRRARVEPVHHLRHLEHLGGRPRGRSGGWRGGRVRLVRAGVAPAEPGVGLRRVHRPRHRLPGGRHRRGLGRLTGLATRRGSGDPRAAGQSKRPWYSGLSMK